ncbi:hypothetical protein BGX33_007196 [Mortierella sp. NVP41]|nr:hypothetical protein BGX33_007196 [Mortierella sp. NVP41]
MAIQDTTGGEDGGGGDEDIGGRRGGPGGQHLEQIYRGYRVKELRFEKDSFKDWAVIPRVARTLSIGSSVKILRIDPNYDWHLLRLLPVLNAFPCLEELYVEPQRYVWYWNHWPRSESYRSEHEARVIAAASASTTTRLRVLVLCSAAISMPSLEAVIRRCPLVEVLKFAFAVDHSRATGKSGIEVFDQSQFMSRLRDSCRRLREFHWSWSGRSDLLTGAKNNGIPSCLPFRPTETTTSSSPYRQCVWSITDRQLMPLWSHVYSDKGDWLTGLEVSRTTQMICSPHTNILRKILCVCPNLVHVTAMSVYFFHEDMDVNNLLGREGVYRKKNRNAPIRSEHPSWRRVGGNPESEEVEPISPRRVWACRNLRTLHLNVVARGKDYSSRPFSLVMFGYLSLVCPRLEELRLHRGLLQLDDESGLCLLGRLRYLERVQIQTMLSAEGPDVLWMRRVSASEEPNRIIFRYKHLLKKDTQHEVTYDVPHGPSPPVSRAMTRWDYGRSPSDTRYLKKLPSLPAFQERQSFLTEDGLDLGGVGRPDDLASWIYHMQKLDIDEAEDRSQHCLPLLDSFYFRHVNGDSELTLDAQKFMKIQRPEVDFRVEIFRHLNSTSFHPCL